MCLIHLIKLIPEFWQIVFRYGLSAVKHGHSDLPVVFQNFDLDTFLISHVVNGIGQIVSHNLLCLKFIRPHKNGFV